LVLGVIERGKFPDGYGLATNGVCLASCSHVVWLEVPRLHWPHVIAQIASGFSVLGIVVFGLGVLAVV
jgi:hypothetical protein